MIGEHYLEHLKSFAGTLPVDHKFLVLPQALLFLAKVVNDCGPDAFGFLLGLVPERPSNFVQSFKVIVSRGRRSG